MKKYIDYYELLGVNEQSTEQEIRYAYRKKAKKYHPDMQKNVSEEEKQKNTQKFIKLTEAYEILSDTTKKIEYDNKRREYLRKQEEKRQREELKRQEELRQQEQVNINKESKEKPAYYDVWNTYKEVIEEEKKDSIKARFERRKKFIPKTKIKAVNGIINILGEIGFQAYKLKKEDKETKTRYMLRNRYNFLSATAILIMLLFGSSNKEVQPKDVEIIETMDENTIETIIDTIIEQANVKVLNNYHTVEMGDTLSELAQRGHITMTTLKEANNINRDTIYLGEELIIPYHINNDLLEYYTETVSINNRSLEEIAIEYNTDIESLKVLNNEGITEDNIILTDEILVPKFLTEKEYLHLKYNVLDKSYVKHD